MRRDPEFIYWFVIVLMVIAFGLVATLHAADKDTTHRIEAYTVFEGRTGSCSGTAIAPQALLTATHCEGDEITVDGERVEIKQILRDGRDHSILLLQGVRFPKWAAVAKESKLEIGEHVSIIGNPSYMKVMYREGYVSGISECCTKYRDGGLETYWIDINGFYGDSGSGIFNAANEVVMVLSSIRVLDREQTSATSKFMGAFALNFDTDQLNTAQKWCLTCEAPVKPDFEPEWLRLESLIQYIRK